MKRLPAARTAVVRRYRLSPESAPALNACGMHPYAGLITLDIS
jgi:hypothetical protein